MTRPARAFCVDAQELEGRLLLAALPVAIATATTTTTTTQVSTPVAVTPVAPLTAVQFDGISPSGTGPVTQVVSQQASTATLILSRRALTARCRLRSRQTRRRRPSA